MPANAASRRNTCLVLCVNPQWWQALLPHTWSKCMHSNCISTVQYDRTGKCCCKRQQISSIFYKYFGVMTLTFGIWWCMQHNCEGQCTVSAKLDPIRAMEYSVWTRSTPYLLIPWLLLSPGQYQTWYSMYCLHWGKAMGCLLWVCWRKLIQQHSTIQHGTGNP